MLQSTIYCIDDFDLKDKNVFIRTDFNIPVKNGKITNHIRLEAAISTIEYALRQQARVIIGSHRGRPDRTNRKELSLEPFGYYLGEKLNCEVVFAENTTSPLPSVLLSSLNSEKVVLLENLRFHSGEERGDPLWADQIASYVDVYINEAFSVSHRSHMSVSALPLKVKKKGQGFSMKKERNMLDHLLYKVDSPMALLIGGVKIGDKIKTLNRLVDQLDILLIGGVMAHVFLKAKGENMPGITQDGVIAEALNLMDRLESRGKQILLPVDHWLSEGEESSPRVLCKNSNIPSGFFPMDIGPQTVKLFSETLQKAKTIFWNGPMGLFEDDRFAEGTMRMSEVVAGCKDAFRIVGGGDSIAAVLKSGKSDSFDYVSTGGGAALKYLQTGTLPGIDSLVTMHRVQN